MSEYDVVLLPTFAEVEDWRKRQAASCKSGLFAQTVTTFNAWIADLWELHGDGRGLVDSLQRQVIMQAAFEQVSAGDPTIPAVFADGARTELSVSTGMVGLAAKCVRFGAGVPAFDRALDQAYTGFVPAGLAPREALLLQCIGSYRDLLTSAELVELGSAAAYLVQHASSVFPQPVRVLLAFDQPLTWLQSSFFSSCPNIEVTVSCEGGAGDILPMPSGVQLRFGFPSGRYAQAALVADILRELREEAQCSEDMPMTVVVSADPLGLYKSLESELANADMVGCVQAQIPFASTDFGREFLSLYRAASEDTWSIDDLSDASQAPFSGFSRSDALAIDRGLRADRAVQRENCLSELRLASDVFSQMEELVSDPEADILLGVFEQIAYTAKGRSDAWRAEQLTAASAVRSCTTAARRVGASMAACARVLEDVVVSVSYQGGTGECLPQPRVAITTAQAASRMGLSSCSHVILCDLTSEDYPVADKDDAAATLFEKLGLMPVETALSHARKTFARLQHLPTISLVCLRPLNDWDGNPTYPAAVLQELVDAYRGGAVGDDDLDAVYGLPEVLMDGVMQRGEEDLYANALARSKGAEQQFGCKVGPCEVGDIAPAARALVALPRRDVQGRVLPGFSPSPSQVEAYLECPYKWFVQSRLRAEELDEGFGPLERGSFSHAVLQRFYEQFMAAGQSKVTPYNLEQARMLMREVAEAEASLQSQLEPGSGRFVAVTQLEQREQQACIRQLVDYLDFEAAFLPTFRPAHLEYEIKYEDGVQYAGHPFVGKVDRIDVDDAGRAVIIDYKGSVGPAHTIAKKNPMDPGKVQARMYAQVIRRALGLDVVGALYVCYGKEQTWAGAYDGGVLESAHLPNAKCEKNRCLPVTVFETPGTDESRVVQDYAELSFADMLDETEKLVADAIARMEAGKVGPAPAKPDVCKYCPAGSCPKRGE